MCQVLYKAHGYSVTIETEIYICNSNRYTYVIPIKPGKAYHTRNIEGKFSNYR